MNILLQVWYRGVITALAQDDSSATVKFVDYGNEDSVNFQFILTSSSRIPPGQEDFIDENVELEYFASQPAVLAAKSVAVESKSEEKKGVVEKKKVEKVVEKKVEKVVNEKKLEETHGK